jgi:hypothetical protein
MDDNSNLILSEWYNNRINGKTFIVLGREFIKSYGVWLHGKLHGINTIEYDNLQVVALYKNGLVQNTILVIDQPNSLIYLLQNHNHHSDDFVVSNRIDFSSGQVVDFSALLGLQY